MILRFLFLLSCFLIANGAVFSQEETAYTFVKRDSLRGLKIFETVEEQLDELWNEYQGDYKKEFKELKKPVKTRLKYEYSRIYFNSEYENYLKQILKELVDNNPDLQKLKFRVYFSRIPIPNASTYIDGTIFINIGLLQILDSEAQLAMIIGHELAHWQEQHSKKGFEELHSLLGSDDIQSMLREAKNTNGNRRLERLEKLSKSIDMTDSKHGRDHESESDSISLTYLRNTKYDLNDAILATLNLRQADTELFHMNDILKETFTFSDLPFSSKWIYKKQSMSDRMKFSLSKAELDSFKTHPDPELRYQYLLEDLKTFDNKEGQKFVVSEELFKKMKQDFTYQSVDVLFHSNKVSMAMYSIFNQQYKGDTSEFLRKSMYKCLSLIHEKLLDHTLGRYVDLRNPYFAPEYNKLTIFIDNLNLDDLDRIKESYKVKHNIKL